jgi:hypothetical protein
VKSHSLLSPLAYDAILDIWTDSSLCFMLANILVVGGCDVGVFAAVAARWRQNCDCTGTVTSKHGFESGITPLWSPTRPSWTWQTCV